MKKYLTVALALLTALALTTAAHADVIAAPEAVVLTVLYLPWILVGAAVGITVFLLVKFWKKKR